MDTNIVQLLNLHAEPTFCVIKYLSGFNSTVRFKKKSNIEKDISTGQYRLDTINRPDEY